MSAASNYLETRVLDFFLKNNAQSTSSPSTVFVGLFNTDDSAGAGNVLFYGALTTSKTIESGDTFQITAGNLSVTLA